MVIMDHSTLQPIKNDYPIDRTICVFKSKKGVLFLGYFCWSINTIKVFGNSDYTFSIEDIESYQYVLDEKGAFII